MDSHRDGDKELKKLVSSYQENEKSTLHRENEKLKDEVSVLKEEIERMTRKQNLSSKNKDTIKKHKNLQNQQEEKESENEASSQEKYHLLNKKINVEPLARLSDSKAVTACANYSKEPFCINKKNGSPEKKMKTQSTSPENTRGCDLNKSEHIEMEIVKDYQMRLQFPTYKTRKGPKKHGKDHEYLLCAYYALKFSLNGNELCADFAV